MSVSMSVGLCRPEVKCDVIPVLIVMCLAFVSFVAL